MKRSQIARAITRIGAMHTTQSLQHQLPQVRGLLHPTELSRGVRETVLNLVEGEVHSLVADVSRVAVHVGSQVGEVDGRGRWQHVYELVLPALAEFGISEAFQRSRIDHGSRRQEEHEEPAREVGKPVNGIDDCESANGGEENRETEADAGGGHLGRLEFDETKGSVETAGLSLESRVRQPLYLELAPVRRVLLPLAYAALVHAQRERDRGLGAEMGDHVRGLHGR